MALEIVKAEGLYLIDKNKKKYLDLISGISVSNVGHSHPEIINAVKEQAEKYMHLMVFGEYIQTPQTRLAEALSKKFKVNKKKIETIMETFGGATEDLYLYVDKNKYTI